MTRIATRIVLPLAVLTATLALALPAQASLTRTFVSSAGSDSNPCTITQPCATFAHAYSLTAANGVVAALDPGKYGPVTVTTGITINGNGWAAITAPASGNGITINAGVSDKVTLTGLEIDGAGAGANGIVFNSGGSLTVANCTLENFVGTGNAGIGIYITPMSGTIDFTVTNTTAANNSFVGIFYFPTSGSPIMHGVIDHVVTTANQYGISIDVSSTSGGSSVATIADSVASNNSTGGIFAATASGSGTLKLSIDNVSVSANSTGVNAINTVNVMLGRSVITGNGIGTQNSTSPNTFYTFKDNRISLNNTIDINGALNTSFATE